MLPQEGRPPKLTDKDGINQRGKESESNPEGAGKLHGEHRCYWCNHYEPLHKAGLH